jgi:formylglycine-generating enzyme required for sulfatase activity
MKKTLLAIVLTLLAACQSKVNLPAIEMVSVKGGEFVFNCQYNDISKCKSDLIKAYTKHIDSFQISKYEITVAQFKSFIDATGYRTTADKIGYSYYWKKVEGTDSKVTEKGKGLNWRYNENNELRKESEYNKPVIHVSWIDCNKFCKWLSKRTGMKYIIPTFEQWEYAARGGQLTKNFLYSGSDIKNEIAWNYYNSDMQIHDVGQLAPNELGIYDMNGNVWEWTTMKYSDKTQMVRGGSFMGANIDILIDADERETSYSICNNGFRVVIEK